MKSKISFCCQSASRKRRSPGAGAITGATLSSAQHAAGGGFPQSHPVPPQLHLGFQNRLAVLRPSPSDRAKKAPETLSGSSGPGRLAPGPALEKICHQPLALPRHQQHVAGELFPIQMRKPVGQRRFR